MNGLTKLTTLLLAVVSSAALAQGTFTFDQQSAGEALAGFANAVQADFGNTPPPRIGQTFSPSLSSISFVRLRLGDQTSGNGIPTSFVVSLFDSPNAGNLLGSTEPVFIPDGFAGATNLIFQSPISLTPGNTYYFEVEIPMWTASPVGGLILSDNGTVQTDFADTPYNYPGGTAFYAGQPLANRDLWFREGIVVPEPTAFALLVIGAVIVACPPKPKTKATRPASSLVP